MVSLALGIDFAIWSAENFDILSSIDLPLSFVPGFVGLTRLIETFHSGNLQVWAKEDTDKTLFHFDKKEGCTCWRDSTPGSEDEIEMIVLEDVLHWKLFYIIHII